MSKAHRIEVRTATVRRPLSPVKCTVKMAEYEDDIISQVFVSVIVTFHLKINCIHFNRESSHCCCLCLVLTTRRTLTPLTKMKSTEKMNRRPERPILGRYKKFHKLWKTNLGNLNLWFFQPNVYNYQEFN
uniref:Uncharacterized protein n=1 Tax=Cacopsylla melanoneura TaxID=428564 RepID=A0A8D8T9M4_9HEMI